MRILHVVPSYLPAVRYGGPIFAVHGLCRALAANGHHVEVLTTNVDGPNDSAVPLDIPVLLDGVHVRYFSSRTLRRLYWSPPLARAINGAIGSFCAVHLHSVFLWPTWVAARAARDARLPYLMSPLGMLVKELIQRRSRMLKLAWIEMIERRNLENASAIQVTSELEAQELRRFGWRLPRIATIPHGIDDIESFSKAELSPDVEQIAAHGPFILFLGRISWKKGLDRLLRAFALTNIQKLLIVGPDEENLAPRLAALVRDLEMTGRVRFLPRAVVGADKEHLYASARIFVLPSYSENFGIAVLEAMRRGVPVVVTPEVGAADVVRQAKAGLVVPGDPEPLSTAMRRLTENITLARSMGEAGSCYVRENYSWSRIASQMEELYASLTV